MTAEEKVIAMQNGTRKINLKSCSPQKLDMYLNIAIDLGFLDLANKIREVQNYEFTRADIEKYIEHYTNEIGDFGGDLDKDSNEEKSWYAWGCDRNTGEVDEDFVVYNDRIEIDGMVWLFKELNKKTLKAIMEDYIFAC